MAKIPSAVEIVFGQFVKNMSREDALRQTKATLESLPGIDFHLAELEVEHKQKVLQRTKLTEIGTARKRDLHELGWYSGVGDDGAWGPLRERMRSSIGDAVISVDRSTEEIMASIAEPRVDHDKRLGLVIGNVQSGKTANFAAVAAKALDSGYKFVLVLSGVHNNLRKQTQERLERDLGLENDPSSWYKLTGVQGDFGTESSVNASSIVANHDRILAVVKKNGGRLRNVLQFLRKIDADTMRDTPFLIIDDESDQATPDASAKLEDDPTAINKLMKQIWAELRNGTYIGYTATPFANVLMNPNSDSELLQELYPREFIHVMPTPKTYFGAERIFGLNDFDSEERDAEVPDVIRPIPGGELAQLVPKGRDLSGFTPAVTKSLGDAIRWFIVACAVRRLRGQQKKHSTMLIHTTHRIDPHFATRDVVEAYLEPLRQLALDGDVEEFREIFREEINRAAGLYTGDGIAPTWPRIREEIPNVLRVLKLSVDNGRAEESDRLSYGELPQTVIVIGGGTLSRGLTLEGLFVSFFTRTSNTYDTLLQMGRWFGYRIGYEDLQRIWLSPGLEEDYRFLATVESDLRADVARMTAAGDRPADIGVRVLLHPGRLQVTSPAKMKHAKTVEADFEGYRLQTTRFDVSSGEALDKNARAAEALFAHIASYRSPAAPTLFENVPLKALTPFFREVDIHEQFRKIFHDAVAWTEEKLPDTGWNVFVPAEGRGPDFINIAGTQVNALRRTPIRTHPETLRSSGEINIRALMAANDIVADLRAQGKTPHGVSLRAMSNDDQYTWRRARDGGSGRGLLVIYPISRHSQSTSEERMPMADALSAIDDRLIDAERPPLIGFAMIAPTDIENRLKSKGTKIAVVPTYSDSDDIAEEVVSDNERDFQGEMS
ncbi:Z1 domain-containing protein [Microbacterium sp. A82]|uniref:Z1 domain-containing protein n=1 Tax=Microbacterium sp. A82 TaxID=3450452 RepID=UPI003F3CF0E9